MLIRKNIFIVLSLTVIIAMSACGGRGTPDAAATLAPIYTAAAQTLQALSSQAGMPATPTPLPPPPPTVIPPTQTLTVVIPPSVPNTPVPVTRCDWAFFVVDVSVPDGSTIAPSTAFTKTWRLRNNGTCTWTSAYQLVFYNGNAMGGPASQPLTPGTVAPGQMVDISVSLTSPILAGPYRGYWMLQNPSGARFGFGAQANTAFWVDIKVVGNPTTTTIIADTPDPSVIGQAVVVTYTVTSTGGTPTGNVTVSDGTINCTGTVAAGTCTLTPTTAGAKTLTATYAGDANYAGSSDTESHTVSQGPTTTTITADAPDPSTPGQSVAVSVTVSGTGISPTGTVIITGADTNCTITLSGGIGSCNAVFTTAGAKTLTATYSGDGNYMSSSDTESHTVNTAYPF